MLPTTLQKSLLFTLGCNGVIAGGLSRRRYPVDLNPQSGITSTTALYSRRTGLVSLNYYLDLLP